MPIDLGDNLKLRFATLDDVEALAEFNIRLHDDANLGPSIRDLMSGNHPTCKASDFTIVEDTETGKIVSSLCFISQTWIYGGIPFKFGQPEWIATDVAYRRRGFVRKQFEVIHALSESRGELMQGITGIPWYYRRFGYEMALDREAEVVIDGMHIPTLKKGKLRRADSDRGQMRITLSFKTFTRTRLSLRFLHAIEVPHRGSMNSTGDLQGATHATNGYSSKIWMGHDSDM